MVAHPYLKPWRLGLLHVAAGVIVLVTTMAAAQTSAQAPAPSSASGPTPAAPPASASTPAVPALPAPAAPSLVAARATFLRQVLAESQLLTEQYERALAKLESELAAAAEYEEAWLVQQRRADLKALYATTDSSLAQSLAVPLLPAQARLSGVEARGDVLTGWRTGNSSAEWSGVRVPTGRYYLELEANLLDVPVLPGSAVPGRAQPMDRAAFDFYEVSLLPGAEENRRGFEVALSADDTAFTPIRVGPVSFTRSPVTLRLSTPAGYPGNLVRLRNLRLVPATEPVPAVTAPVATATASLDELRNSLNQSLAAAQKPVIDNYVAELDRLAASLPAAGEAVEAEKKRTQKLVAATSSGAPLRLLTMSSPAVGFEDFEGARFVPDPANRGDRFMVEHEGRRFPVRLLWLQCAPTDDQDAAALKAFAQHFAMDEDHVPGLGRAAHEFTEGYLTGKPLRLLARPRKDKDGSVAALVFLPELGFYQNVLIDQGLAAVQPPPQGARRGMLESTLLGDMLDRERAARRQKPAPGAWAFFGEAGK